MATTSDALPRAGPSHKPQGAVGLAVGLDQPREILLYGFLVGRHSHVHQLSVARHAGPVAVPREQDAF